MPDDHLVTKKKPFYIKRLKVCFFSTGPYRSSSVIQSVLVINAPVSQSDSQQVSQQVSQKVSHSVCQSVKEPVS